MLASFRPIKFEFESYPGQNRSKLFTRPEISAKTPSSEVVSLWCIISVLWSFRVLRVVDMVRKSLLDPDEKAYQKRKA